MKERIGFIMPTSNKFTAFGIFNSIMLGMFALIALFPLYYVFVVSFTTPEEYGTRSLILFPQTWSLASYEYLLSTSMFIKALGVSTFLATVGTFCSLTVTCALAYTISRKRMPGRRIIMLGILLTVLFHPGIIPAYMVVRGTGLINSVWALILPVLSSGWYVLLMRSFFSSIPESLEDAALIDGCNETNAFFRIILPLSLPSLAAFGLFFAVGYWNAFFTAVLYINDSGKWPLQIILRNMLIDSSTSTGGVIDEMARLPEATKKMAAIIIATVPIILVYPFLQKHFAKGVMVGAVKE
jgi:putative aldouronate transport system permease protein